MNERTDSFVRIADTELAQAFARWIRQAPRHWFEEIQRGRGEVSEAAAVSLGDYLVERLNAAERGVYRAAEPTFDFGRAA
ncbi:hypothetical protein [Sphingomonas quercus]|uniref:Uncharacterized protein n=1 Tax=Sphingomonas quercus TaxID=2842451 RepID=A0ABS6BH08_9SPHN|nr:hypothetical protein [Sphingomonas quercus]MBU3077464.1 hypothetical protein [Sphingomonas quercus]